MNTGIGILFLFFNKTETTQIVLERILESKPEVLLLAQDGAREGNKHDSKAVPECRRCVEELVKKIDWPCQVFRNYSKVNMGCDPREYSAISWAFQYVSKLIILEDDCLCAKSFFPFMNEMLNKYEYDERISMISGMERFDKNPFCKESYYFTQACCGCGWATWKRCWNEVEHIARDYEFLDNKIFVHNLDKYVKKCCPRVFANYKDESIKNRERNRAARAMLSWEFAQSTSMILESRLSINPCVNLVKNIGTVEGAAHSGNDIRTIPKRYRRVFELDYHEMQFPLIHPYYVLRDMQYEEMYDRVFYTNKLLRMKDDIEHVILCIKYGKVKDIIEGGKRRIKRRVG